MIFCHIVADQRLRCTSSKKADAVPVDSCTCEPDPFVRCVVRPVKDQKVTPVGGAENHSMTAIVRPQGFNLLYPWPRQCSTCRLGDTHGITGLAMAGPQHQQ